MSDFESRIDSFEGHAVTVLGDAMLDGYLEGYAERVCREAPVPVVRLRGERYVCGGAANMAVNLAALGASVRFVSLTGDDADGAVLRGLLQEAGVDGSGVVSDTGRSTIAKRRLVADGQLLVRYDVGDTTPPPVGTARRLVAALDEALDGSEALVVSDYRSGTVTRPIIDALACRRRTRIPLLVVDSAALGEFRLLRPDLAKPSIAEALAQLAIEPSAPSARPTLAEALGDALLDLSGARSVALTMDEDGAVVFARDAAPQRVPPRHRGPAHPAGAGDTFLAAFTLALLSGAETTEAAAIAQTAAEVVVAKTGTSVCSTDELRAALGVSAVPVMDESSLRDELERQRAAGRQIVFTNGCFDLLHPGHIALLEAAKRLGDDEAAVLSAVSAIDYLVPFGEPTARRLVETLRPDVYVKGGDYSTSGIPEAQAVTAAGGRVEILPYFGNESTSALIERIRTLPSERVS